jgi:hypothetical protein
MTSGFAADMLLLSAVNIDAEETKNARGPDLSCCCRWPWQAASPSAAAVHRRPQETRPLSRRPIQQLSIDPGLIMPCERLRFSRSPGYLRKEMLAVLNGFVAA